MKKVTSQMTDHKEVMIIGPGSTITDKVSGLTGRIEILAHFRTGCAKVAMRRSGVNKDGDPYELIDVEVPDIEGYEDSSQLVPPPPGYLGKEFKDSITGVVGTVNSVTLTPYATPRVVMIRPLDKDGKTQANHGCDITDLVDSTDKVPVVKNTKPGGPAKRELSRVDRY